MADLIGELRAYYRDFLAGDPQQLERFYRDDLLFRDPLHELQGIPAVRRYFVGMRDGLARCEFEFDDACIGQGSACLPWRMHFAHRALNGGRVMTLRGSSLLKFEGLIYYHEDFYDLGAMVYERVPLLGALVRGVKKRLQNPGAGELSHSADAVAEER
ncbi:nuclear transport factor 2 family protein [uncultured Microbulbifer sp.]|uniref:nuclear transport factor 2 family protein n=1 Tax=uncultured Microbulbifer sp. TaxID=348147 RepID=UPI0025ED5E53|nr:nuclear transport factor 2 family protein [uncultured Microbulbifer sp.]